MEQFWGISSAYLMNLTTVSEAITDFLEGDSFEDIIRIAVSLGGDCDILTVIADSITEGMSQIRKYNQVLVEWCIPRTGGISNTL